MPDNASPKKHIFVAPMDISQCALRYQPPSKTPSLFFAKPPLNLQTVQAPFFKQFPLYIGLS